MVGIRVLGFSGSVLKASYSTALVRAASELLPTGITLELFDLSSIPLHNDDVRGISVSFAYQQAELNARLILS